MIAVTKPNQTIFKETHIAPDRCPGCDQIIYGYFTGPGDICICPHCQSNVEHTFCIDCS